MNNKYIECFNKYKHIVIDRISKICPEYLNDSDFVQDVYVEVIDYIKNNKSYNNVSSHLKAPYIHNKVNAIINSLLKNRNKENNYPGYDEVLVDIDFENRVTDELLKESISNVLKTLTSREEKVLKLRFGLENGIPMTYKQLSKQFNVTTERIRQIEAKAVRKLRHPDRVKYIQWF